MTRPAVCLIALFTLLAVLSGAALAQDTWVATADWTPPDLSALTAGDDPGLLVLSVAQGEIGYIEEENNESKYGEWFCGHEVEWCAELITWCVAQAEERYGVTLMNDVYPFYGMPEDGAPFFMEKGRFISDTGIVPVTNQKQWLLGADDYMQAHDYTPSPGDYVWFYLESRNDGTSHVALVEGVSRDPDGSLRLHVIEGNMPDRVQRAQYALTAYGIYGFGTSEKRVMSTLRIYQTGNDVLWLKQSLEALGYYKMETRRQNEFTDALRTAVRAFQGVSGIRRDGAMSLETWKAVCEALACLE